MIDALEIAARAAYCEWIKGVECAEEKWEDLPECHRLRLMDSIRAAFETLPMTGEQISWLCDLLSGPDHIPNEIHNALAARGYVIRAKGYTVITDSGRAIAEKLK